MFKAYVVSLGWSTKFAFRTLKEATAFLEIVEGAIKVDNKYFESNEYYVPSGAETIHLEPKCITTEEEWITISTPKEITNEL